ncbi:MAG: YiiD C-terminal domain-containing protein [Rhodanobacter sp.]
MSDLSTTDGIPCRPIDRVASARTLTRFMREEIPLARAMDVQLAEYSGNMVSLRVPLAPNVNDKGCAFGGSLVSLMTLTGWALVELALRERGEACDVYVGESTVHYLAPLWQDFRSEARLAGGDWTTFFATLAARGKARIEVACRVPGDNGTSAATLSARFVAKRRQ